MRLFVLFIAIFSSSSCFAFQPTSFAEAWRYLSEKNKSERWVVISSKTKQGYFQCENLDDAVRCVIPVWSKQLQTHSQRVLPIGGRDDPYPEVKGSKMKEFLAQDKVEKAKLILKIYGLEPFYVYSQIQDESEKIIGTQCDVRVMISFKYKNFEKLSKQYLKELFGISEQDGYIFETDS